MLQVLLYRAPVEALQLLHMTFGSDSRNATSQTVTLNNLGNRLTAASTYIEY
jgi:hypothetical protein